MPNKKAIQAHLAHSFPQLATVYLQTNRVLLGASAPVAGIEALRTPAYLLSTRLADGAILPLVAAIEQWDDSKALLVQHGCLVAGSLVISERIIYDQITGTRASSFHLWAV